MNTNKAQLAEKIINKLATANLVTMHDFTDKYPHIRAELDGDEIFIYGPVDPPGNAYVIPQGTYYVDVHLDGDAIDWGYTYESLCFTWSEDEEKWMPDEGCDYDDVGDADADIYAAESADWLEKNAESWAQEIIDALEIV